MSKVGDQMYTMVTMLGRVDRVLGVSLCAQMANVCPDRITTTNYPSIKPGKAMGVACVYLYVGVCLQKSVRHVHAVLLEARRGCWGPWNWSSRCS